MSTPAAPWAQTCPLCGQDNRCAVAQGLPAPQCWCMQARIDPAALEALAPQERGQRCLCAACGRPTAGAAQGDKHPDFQDN